MRAMLRSRAWRPHAPQLVCRPSFRLAEAQQGVIANALLLLRYLSFAFPQVERERDGGVRPAAPIRNADEQGSVYMKLAGNPVDNLKGITGYH